VTSAISWPEGKRFAFTVFDDTDGATLERLRPVYGFLAECGLRTTKSCWPVAGDPDRGSHPGATCEDPEYRAWVQDLQQQGFEIGWHGATWHGLPRPQIAAALDVFAEIFDRDPYVASNHSESPDSIYWGRDRLSGSRAWIYNVLTAFRNWKCYRGHVEGGEYFWGDLCRDKIKYYRSFVFLDANTLRACPFMPYHDPRRPYVNYWFASSEGGNVERFNRCLSEQNQDRLVEQGGACIMYTHFAQGFAEHGQLHPRFKTLIRRLARLDGWFVPAGTLLDYLVELRGHHEITPAERRTLERKWLWEKLRVGTT